MNLFLRKHQMDLQSGKAYLVIKSTLQPKELKQPRVINKGSVQGNAAKKYLKVNRGIGYEHIAFVFDTTRQGSQLVIQYKEGALPEGINQSVYYTSTEDISIITRVVSKYGNLPFEREPVVPVAPPAPVVVAEKQKSNPIKEESPKSSIVKDSVAVKSVRISEPSEGVKNPIKPPVVQSIESKKRKSPMVPSIGIKTNLLYWGGIMPDLKRRKMLPNLEMEWYHGDHWSVNADGGWIRRHNINKDYEQWSVSFVGIEPRYWLSGSGNYHGFYGGLYGLLGSFDVKLNSISEKGRTGNYQEGGASAGYYIPLATRLGLEAGVRVGYRKVNGNLYFNTPHFYYDSPYTPRGIKLTGLRLLLTYRLGKNQQQITNNKK